MMCFSFIRWNIHPVQFSNALLLSLANEIRGPGWIIFGDEMKVVELKVVNQFSRELSHVPFRFGPIGKMWCQPFRKKVGSLTSSKCIFSSTVSSNLGWSRDLQIINLIWMETARPSVGRRMLRWKRRRELGKDESRTFWSSVISIIFGRDFDHSRGYCSESNNFLNKVEWIGIWNDATNISCGYEHVKPV